MNFILAILLASTTTITLPLSDDCPAMKMSLTCPSSASSCSCNVYCVADGKTWPARADQQCYSEDAPR
jgi:hypothetical protein